MKVIADQLLPVGSVILLKEAQKRLMIIGVDQVHPETEEAFDYSSVFYPEGNLGEGSTVLFNHEDIDQVYFVGYSDIERQQFIAELKQVAEELDVKESEEKPEKEK